MDERPSIPTILRTPPAAAAPRQAWLLRPARSVDHFQQQDLAAKYGVGAFCYYIYWFGGRRLLEKPLEIVLREKELPLDYFFCWANENWTKTWDGLDSEQLVTQTHDRDRDARIIDVLHPTSPIHGIYGSTVSRCS